MDLDKLIKNACKIYESTTSTVYRRGSKIYKVVDIDHYLVIESHIHGLGLPHVVPLNKIQYLTKGLKRYVLLEFPYYPETLRSYMKKYPYLSIEQRIIFVKDIATALTALHFAGYYHCELTPDNILIKDGRAYVTDFSQAVRMTSIDSVSKNDISPFYLRSPEYHYQRNNAKNRRPISNMVNVDVVFNNPYDRNKADSWAFGMIAYIILAGILDFDRNPNDYIDAYLRSIDPFNYLLIRINSQSKEGLNVVRHLYRNHLNFSQSSRCVSPVHLCDLSKIKIKIDRIVIPDTFKKEEGRIHWSLYSQFIDEIMIKLGANVRSRIRTLELSYHYWDESIWDSVTLYGIYWICVGLDLESHPHISIESVVKEVKMKCEDLHLSIDDLEDRENVSLFAEELTVHLKGHFFNTSLLNFVDSKKIVYEAVKKGYHEYGKLIEDL